MTDLVVRTRLSISSATSSFCNVGTSTFWYPVAPGTTTLPAPPNSTVNANPLPANAVAIPEDFDPTNLCYLFQDLLPVNQGPVFPTVLTPAVNFQPYTEIVPTEGVTYTSLTITEYPYALTLPTGTIDLPTKAAVTYVIPITGEAGGFTLTGQSAGKLQGYRVAGDVGAFALNGQSATFKQDRIFAAGAGTFTLTGQSAQIPWQRLPFPADAGSFTLTGQDAIFSQPTYGLYCDVGSFTTYGESVQLIGSFVIQGSAASFALTGFQTTPEFSSGWSSGGTSNITDASPINVYYRRTIFQTLYTVQDFTDSGITTSRQFNKLQWYVTGAVPSTNSIQGMTIKIFHTTRTDNTQGAYTPITGESKTTVYSDSSTTEFTKAETTGALTVDFATPFTWNGTNNIVVEACTSQNQLDYSVSGTVRCTTVANVSVYNRDDNAGNACTALTPDTGSNIKPALKLQ